MRETTKMPILNKLTHYNFNTYMYSYNRHTQSKYRQTLRQFKVLTVVSDFEKKGSSKIKLKGGQKIIITKADGSLVPS